MKYLLFDQHAISSYVSEYTLQSVEFSQGQRLVDHICGRLSSELFCNTVIEYSKNGILFIGKNGTHSDSDAQEHKLFCIDLVACDILSEASNPSDLLTIIQKSFRLVLKIWNRQPFSSAERYHESKSILFPFPRPDHRRIVIERSNNILRLDKRGIKHPLLAYKYNAEDPAQIDDIVDTTILKRSCEAYLEQYSTLRQKLDVITPNDNNTQSTPLMRVQAEKHAKRDDFIFWNFDQQYDSLTDSQKAVVDYSSIDSPLRIEGAAGTGKTISMIMRAYHLLCDYQKKGLPFRIIFFAHSESTSVRNQELFSIYPQSSAFLSKDSAQNILFTTLLEFCSNFSDIPESSLIHHDAIESKNYQLSLISSIVEKAISSNTIKTYRPLLSQNIRDLFDPNKTAPNTLYHMLQHEFSVQIKGRTDGTIDSYYELSPIPNGIQYENKRDRELLYSLFSAYQNQLQTYGAFDVDDVTMEALSRLDAPIWRRRRMNEGYDYIFVDEMHLFNINEQSIFHFLTKNLTQKSIPICFALDYSQAVGDRGNIRQDYIETAFGAVVEEKKLHTIFRNSPAISDFCASVAAAGTLMFGSYFSNPYGESQNGFTGDEEDKAFVPELHMYRNDDEMIAHLDKHISDAMKTLQCKASDIAVISFENSFLTNEGVKHLSTVSKREFCRLDLENNKEKDKVCLVSPYAINGLEFQAVILLGADEGRVPQTTGTSDISKHFIRYSAYNLLYLSASRAKYLVRILGSKLNGVSTCLEHSVHSEYLTLIDHTQ